MNLKGLDAVALFIYRFYHPMWDPHWVMSGQVWVFAVPVPTLNYVELMIEGRNDAGPKTHS